MSWKFNALLSGDAAAKSMGIPADVWRAVIEETVPPKFKEVNLKAFDLGYGV